MWKGDVVSPALCCVGVSYAEPFGPSESPPQGPAAQEAFPAWWENCGKDRTHHEKCWEELALEVTSH